MSDLTGLVGKEGGGEVSKDNQIFDSCSGL